jgi:hypothetical protein
MQVKNANSLEGKMKYINNISEFPEVNETKDETEALYEERSGDKSMNSVTVLAIYFYIIGFMAI